MSKKCIEGTAFVFLFITAVVASWVNHGYAAEPRRFSPDGVWEALEGVPPSAAQAQPWVRPTVFQPVTLKQEALMQSLALVPHEAVTSVRDSQAVVSIPMPDGSFARFRVVESPVMAPALAAKFPQIKTYLGQGIDDPAATVRFDWTPQGFHAQILSPNGAVYIDPYSKGDTTLYASYYKRDYRNQAARFQCLTPPGPPTVPLGGAAPEALRSGEELLTYRLACAATGEYTQFHGGTVAAGMAAIVTAINRVTGIYEVEVAVRMELIPNNEDIVYTNPATDPYSNFDGFAMLSQNQSNLNAVIGSANYDIGHVFSTGGGGVASLGVVCVNSAKARGVTGLSSPTGDAFYVDYVSHEMGHQYGGNHSFNGINGSCCCGNRHGSTAYEPGSGSTIMAYAGICGVDDLQDHSDPYFHSISFDEIRSFVTFGSGSICPVSTMTGNNPPLVDAGPDYTIPKDTPFALTPASSSDADGDTLTYCWEERDLGPAAALSAPDDGQIPLFRSFEATLDPTRTFPNLSDLLNNISTDAEKLPVLSRTMDMRVTVRDNRAGGGGVVFDQMQITVDGGSGPFVVTQPNTSVAWEGVQTVKWESGGTEAPPVNAATVDILLSTDGGNSFPITLASATPNDGSESVTIPDIPTLTARIKVQATGNIFFDVSDVDFTIGSCQPSAAPVAAPVVTPANRYLSVLPANPGRDTALRVTFVAMPPGFESLESEIMWVGQPRQICENSGQDDTVPIAECGPAPGLSQNWTWIAPLVCGEANAHFMDWSTLADYCVGGSNNGGTCAGDGDCPGGSCGSDGVVHLYHQNIIPSKLVSGGGAIESPAQYDVQAIDITCPTQEETSYSTPLTMIEAGWGDIVLDCTGCPCGQPDNIVNVVTDIVAIFDKFVNLDCAPRKARTDLEPGELDFKINVTDAIEAVDAFTGEDYSFAPATPCP